MLAPSSTSLGINCRGSFFCSYGPWSHDRPSLDDDIISIFFALAADRMSICTLEISCGPVEDADIYLPGEHIICWPYGRSFLGSICDFTRGNVSSTGTNGTVIKDKLAALKTPGCTLCGNASKLGTFSNDSGFSSCSLGPPKALPFLTAVKRLKVILVAQDRDALTIWAINSSDELGYLRTTTANLDLGSPTTDTRLWQKQPFYVTDSGEMYEIASYTTRIVLRDSEGGVLKHAKAFMSAKSSTQATSNGRRTTLQQSGSWIATNEDGEITIITPTQDIGSAAMTLFRIRGSEGCEFNCERTTIDPCTKVMERLSHIDENFDLANATTQPGKRFFEISSVPDKATLKAVSRCFGALKAAYGDLPSNGASIATAAGSLATKSGVPITKTALEAVGDLLRNVWYWIERKVRDVRDWFVEKVIFRGLNVGRAVTGVFEKIKVGSNKLCDFIGFLFSWDDIVQTKDAISQLLSANLHLAAEMVEQKRTRVQGLFKAVRQKVGDAVYPKGIKTHTDEPGREPKAKEAISASAFHLTSYRVKNGGLANNIKLASGAPLSTRLHRSKLCDALSDQFFRSRKKIDVDVIFTILGDVLVSAIDGVAEIVDKLILFAIKFIKLIKVYGNKEIDIPIFSPLYKRTSGGHELTVFDAVSLLVAIPIAVLIKE
ncbi:MAG: hypothetical protein Q9180_001209 [Flavoplaca navasiana]